MATNPIKASIKLQARIRKARLSARQLVFADLLNLQYEPKDAYQLSGLYDSVLIPAINWKNMRTLMQENETFTNYIPPYTIEKRDLRKTKELKPNKPTPPPTPIEKGEYVDDTPKDAPHTITDEEMAELLSKDNQLKELLWKLKHEELDTKTELDIRKMIAELTNAKKEQTQIEEKRTVFYLPLKCNQCALYINAQSKKKRL